MTHTYSIAGMTCGNCVAKVKSELLKTKGITAADIQLQSPQATITMQRHIDIVQLQHAVSNAGKFIITEEHTAMPAGAASETTSVSYYPIFLIFGYIAGATLLAQLAQGRFDLVEWMRYFMGGFFLVFSFFKLLNLKGFAESYRSYDIVAKQAGVYGYVYPFIELALGVALITGYQPMVTNAATLLVMGVSMVGVVQSLVRKTQFQCACLGTIIQLPLSKVTLFEDLLMVAMSGAMLLMI